MDKANIDERIRADMEAEGKTAERLDIKGIRMKSAPAGFTESVTGGQAFYKSEDGLSVFMTLEQGKAVHVSVMRRSRRPEWKDIDRVVSLFVPRGAQPMIVLPPAGSRPSGAGKNIVNIFFWEHGAVERPSTEEAGDKND